MAYALYRRRWGARIWERVPWAGTLAKRESAVRLYQAPLLNSALKLTRFEYSVRKVK